MDMRHNLDYMCMYELMVLFVYCKGLISNSFDAINYVTCHDCIVHRTQFGSHFLLYVRHSTYYIDDYYNHNWECFHVDRFEGQN